MSAHDINFFFLSPTRMNPFHTPPPQHIAPTMLHNYCFIIIYVCLITLHVEWICVFKWVEIEKMPRKKKLNLFYVVKVFGPQKFQTRDELFLTWNSKVLVKLHSLCMAKMSFSLRSTCNWALIVFFLQISREYNTVKGNYSFEPRSKKQETKTTMTMYY